MSNEMKEVNDVNYFCSFHAKALQSTDVTKSNFIWKCITSLSKQRLSGCYEKSSVSSPAGDVLWWCTVQEQNDKEKSHCLKMYGPKCVVFFFQNSPRYCSSNIYFLFKITPFLLVLSLCRRDIFFLSLSLLCAFVRTHSGFSCSKWKLDTYWAFVCEQSIKKKKPRQRLKTSQLTYFYSAEDQWRSTQDSHSCEMAKLHVRVKIIILNCLFYLILTFWFKTRYTTYINGKTFNDTILEAGACT